MGKTSNTPLLQNPITPTYCGAKAIFQRIAGHLINRFETYDL
jgi:hypothetical protein